MGPAETAGIVVVTVAIIQGLVGLVRFAIERLNGKSKTNIADDVSELKDKCGLSDRQTEQLTAVYQTVTQKDVEGMPLVYFPRQSYGDVQKEIATQLKEVTKMQVQMLSVIRIMKEDMSK